MNAANLLDACHSRGIILSVEENGLKYRAPVGVLTPELRESIRCYREELIALLTPSTPLTVDTTPKNPEKTEVVSTPGLVFELPYAASLEWAEWEWDSPEAVGHGLVDALDKLFGKGGWH